MDNTNQKRIQILMPNEIRELYERPAFNQTEREEYFALDDDMLKVLKGMDKLETKLYLALLIGYFRAKPVIPKFQLKDVQEDIEFLCKTYFSSSKPKLVTIPKSTRSKLISKMLSMLDFEHFTKLHQANLIVRLKDVATICIEPRYIFDECLAFFGQQRLALAGYTTLQDLITDILSAERQRTELVLSQHMTDLTKQRLRKVLNRKGLLNSLSGYKGSARDFSPAERLCCSTESSGLLRLFRQIYSFEACPTT
ncbi:DUF4158 domain-containing protein [Zooshikella ganghwensis]|uniref:DUF4158 domain-containing protein n=1 Tax=Zooshikella ganghwensis TaxID=202772 RepID=A0A4P9VFR5_9GAMM|nr:DUF4158 domain-containing protein [Zooshikella ganghwensis]RDH41873.1 DUF4158 domain-containing protein [Zooshikella ganghwensis]